MQEDFLHHIWKFQKFSKAAMKTEEGEAIEIVHQGTHNFNSGPDFFNSQIRIGNQLWVGNVEIHLKSSDWYAHHHETDIAYDNVILHVVWKHDVEVFRRDNSVIPTFVLKPRVDDFALARYNKLFSTKKQWIACEEDFPEVDDFLLENWMERLYFERLENKSALIFELLETSKNDWEAVLFKMLAKNFGLKNNAEAFLSMAHSFDFSILRKIQDNHIQLEGLLFGQAGLLNIQNEVPYEKLLKKEYDFLKKKFKLENSQVAPVQFFRLRPVNFPTIRLAQLAAVYSRNKQLFSKIISVKTKEEIYTLFEVSASGFWDTHFHFSSVSAPRKKRLTKSFIDLLIINTIVPLVFCYRKYTGKEIPDALIILINSLKKEENTIVSRFNDLKPLAESALHSQALIELKTNYCDKKKCLQCAVGNYLLQKN
ncbi:DUF2851 family protein [uncultured Planktosalinus sp.]|uniref:DUF2851 family protein n=1 Tax=uncultured Planktosalinus sp. TaxID=1810935 RepID=UPI0030DDB299